MDDLIQRVVSPIPVLDQQHINPNGNTLNGPCLWCIWKKSIADCITVVNDKSECKTFGIIHVDVDCDIG